MVIILNNRLAVSDEKITERELNARRFVRKAAAEGAVLLKNDRTLPLGKSIKKIALFGAGAGQTVRGGTGSGDVNVRSYVTVREGLSDAGYEIVTDRLLKRRNHSIKRMGQIHRKPWEALWTSNATEPRPSE